MTNYIWLVGALCSALGSTCCNLGINTQKYAFMVDDLAKVERPYHKKPLWCLGLFLIVIGSFGDFAALGMAAQSIVAPIGSVTLVANMFFAHFWLGEDISWKDFVGTSCIISGASLAVGFGDHAQQTYVLQDLVVLFDGVGFFVYAVGLFVVTVSLYAAAKYIEPIRALRDRIDDELDKAREENDVAAINVLRSKQTTADDRYSKFAKLHRLCYAATSGIFGGTNILFGKMVSELLSSTFRGSNQLFDPLFYVFFCAMMVSIFFQLHFLAKALMFFDALYVVPVFQCFLVSVSAIGGAAYFREFDNFSFTQWICFPTGVSIALYGMASLSGRSMSGNRRIPSYEDDEEGGEQRDKEQIPGPTGDVAVEMISNKDDRDTESGRKSPSGSYSRKVSHSHDRHSHDRVNKQDMDTICVSTVLDGLRIVGKDEEVLINPVEDLEHAVAQRVTDLGDLAILPIKLFTQQENDEEGSSGLLNTADDHDTGRDLRRAHRLRTSSTLTEDTEDTEEDAPLQRKNNTVARSSVPNLNMLKDNRDDPEDALPALPPVEDGDVEM